MRTSIQNFQWRTSRTASLAGVQSGEMTANLNSVTDMINDKGSEVIQTISIESGLCNVMVCMYDMYTTTYHILAI